MAEQALAHVRSVAVVDLDGPSATCIFAGEDIQQPSWRLGLRRGEERSTPNPPEGF